MAWVDTKPVQIVEVESYTRLDPDVVDDVSGETAWPSPKADLCTSNDTDAPAGCCSPPESHPDGLQTRGLNRSPLA